MDHLRFDTITRVIGSRRSLVGAVVAAMTLATGSRPETFAKKKKKKKPCKGGTIKCGKVCVNASTDPQNCGGCGTRCGNGQACASGSCTSSGPGACPTDQVRCSGLCVDPRSDRQNCGACGVSCGTGETCSSGQCRAASGYPCTTVQDCGGNYRGVVCVDGQCACEKPAEGLCYDPRQTPYGICDVCCPGGNQVCPGDKVCNGPPSPTARCSCASYEDVCYYNPPHRCSQDQATDSNRCGINCIDCIEEIGLTSFCCSGTCMTACEPNTNCNLKTCGGCTTCGTGTACCRSGSSNLFGCTLLEGGRCPGPPA